MWPDQINIAPERREPSGAIGWSAPLTYFVLGVDEKTVAFEERGISSVYESGPYLFFVPSGGWVVTNAMKRKMPEFFHVYA
jgi:hypothetical protein